MNMNRPALKNKARSLMVEAKPNPLLVGLVFILVTYILNTLSIRLTGIQVDANDYYNALMSGNYEYFTGIMAGYHPGAFPVILDIAIRVLILTLSAGFTIYVLNIVRRCKAGYANLLDGFGIFLRILWLDILMAVFVFLWSMLFIVPGIIALYRYRMALYLLIDNPDWSALECISESKRMMQGRKAELFVLDLSFIGWYMLATIPFVSIYVTPYTQLTYAAYYETLRASAGCARPADGDYTNQQ